MSKVLHFPSIYFTRIKKTFKARFIFATTAIVLGAALQNDVYISGFLAITAIEALFVLKNS